MTQPLPWDANATRGDAATSQAFLATHRGQAAFAREYARLITAILADVGQITRNDPALVPVIRQSPERCIVQLGPVAMTMVWLRKGAEATANGELMLMLWRGTIAPRSGDPTEYSARRRVVVPPTILSEETFVAFAVSETAWTWRSGASDADGVSSITLAEQSVRRLVALHQDEAAIVASSLPLV